LFSGDTNISRVVAWASKPGWSNDEAPAFARALAWQANYERSPNDHMIEIKLPVGSFQS
jgi:hypothetical protein